MSRIRVAVAVEVDNLGAMEDIARACRIAGFQSDSRLTSVGVFTGSIDANRLATLRAVPGVAAVEVQRSVRIPSALGGDAQPVMSNMAKRRPRESA